MTTPGRPEVVTLTLTREQAIDVLAAVQDAAAGFALAFEKAGRPEDLEAAGAYAELGTLIGHRLFPS